MDNSKTTTFWKYLKYNNIVIPIIQRDYAQGRIGKEYLREKFLKSLVEALSSGKPLVLDFVYGSESHGAVEPLDGQQRLTTLWLLHWYIAVKCGKLDENKDTFRRFSYETRLSSRNFINAICNIGTLDCKTGIAGYIRQRTWFLDAWRHDPTIKAMLTMIEGTKITDKSGHDIVDGLEEIFSKYSSEQFENLWKKLTDESICPIRFYALNLSDSNLPLSDDLYIKMNARGRVLSDFENFKADLLDHVRQADGKDFGNGYDIRLGALIDNKWMDLFWQMNDRSTSMADKAFMAFLNRFFVTKLVLRSDGNIEKTFSFPLLYGAKGDDTGFRYDSFECYAKTKVLDGDTFKALENILTEVSKINDINKLCTPLWNNQPDDNALFMPVKKEDGGIMGIEQKQRVVFAAVCMYLERYEYEHQPFADWIRFAWNITENSNVNTVDSMARTMRLLNRYSGNADNILRHLASLNSDEAANVQLKEEIVKAKRICQERDDNTNVTEQLIYDAEKYSFFRGAIRPLFTDGSGNTNWDCFSRKLDNAKKMFDKVQDTYDASLMCYFISMFTEWRQICLFDGNRASFNNKGDNWKRLLTNDTLQAPVDKMLMSNEIPAKYHPILDALEPGYEQLCRTVHEELCDVDLMCDVFEKTRGNGRLRWNWEHYTIYKPYERNERMIYTIANKRNDMLAELIRCGKITLNDVRTIRGGRHFTGINIPFTYNGRAFLWCWDDYIYINCHDEQAVKAGRFKVVCEKTDCDSLCKQFERMMEENPY